MLLGIVFRPGFSLTLSLLFCEEIRCTNVQTSLLLRQPYGFNHMNDLLPSQLGHIVALHFLYSLSWKERTLRTPFRLADFEMGKQGCLGNLEKFSS